MGPALTVSMHDTTETPIPITTIDQLVRTLHAALPHEYAAIMAGLRLPEAQVAPYCHWNSKHSTRTCVARTDEFELLVICFEPGQGTSIHDYNSQTAWIHPIRGAILEERFEQALDKLVRRTATMLTPGSFCSMHNEQSIHRFTNTGSERTITLNLYSRPLRKWRVYDERTGRHREKPLHGYEPGQ